MDEPVRPTLDQSRPISGPGPAITIVVPCLNERDNIAPLAASLERALEGWAWELLVVDDDSADGTAAEVQRLGEADRRIRCLRRIGRRGLSSAVIEGALAAAGRVVAVMDGDGQHDEAILPALCAPVLAGECDLAIGSRHVAGGDAAGLASAGRRRLFGKGARGSRRRCCP